MLRRFFESTTGSRVLRTGALLVAASASVATFAGSSTWEVHRQLENLATVTLDGTTTSWSDDFEVSGSGTGATRISFDGAVEVRTNASVNSPVEVRVRFVPMGASTPSDEVTLYATSRTAFAAVQSEDVCQSRMPCKVEGTFEVEIANPSALAGATVDVHWVSTGSIFGRGPAAPADAVLKLLTP